MADLFLCRRRLWLLLFYFLFIFIVFLLIPKLWLRFDEKITISDEPCLLPILMLIRIVIWASCMVIPFVVGLFFLITFFLK